jgi:uncharacterized membrane protein
MDSNMIVLAFEEEPILAEWGFSEPTKADGFLETVLLWQEKGIVEVEDAVIAVRTQGGDIKIKQTTSLAGKFALRGSGIGLLAGLLLGGPIGGLIGGTAIGAIAGKMKDIGVDDKFIEQVSEGLAPNSSAVFLLGKSSEPEKLLEEMRPFKAFVATTTLDEEREKALRKALEREE